MKKLVVFNLFVVTTYITYGQVTNSFPPIGIPTIGGSNYMSINNRLFFQSKNQDINGYNRGVVANNLYWDSAQSKWTNGTSASYDFALLRFESGGNIGFFNGPTPNPSARQTFTNDELETYRTLTLKSTGRVGIGTANPATVLSVFKNSDAADFGVFPSIEINNPNTVGGAYSALIFKSGNTNSTIGVRGAIGELLSYAYNNSTDRYLWLRTLGSSYKLYLGYNKEDFVVSNGNISIGTEDTKGYKLAVNGSAIFTKAVVKTYATWPDYVFDKNYPLMPLDSVEVFIQKNGHLPAIPCAGEIANTGIDLGDNQTKLLQKTEELTLYLIEQNKKIQQLTEENKLLKQQLSQIEEIKTLMAYQQAAIEQLQNESKQTQANK